MAKKKKTEDILDKYLQGEYGDVVVKGSDILDEEVKFISVSPNIDQVTGGVPQGSWFSLIGPPKCGKTTTALTFMAECQTSGMQCFIYPIEARLKSRDLTGIEGLKPEEITIIRSTQGKILTGEDWLNIADYNMKTYPNSVHLFDSLSSICPEAEMNNPVGKATMKAGQLQWSFIRKTCELVRLNKLIVINIGQIMADLGPSRKTKTEKGGLGVQFQADVKLEASYIEPWEENNKQIGQLVHWIVRTTAGSTVGTGRKVDSYIRYGKGVDKAKESIMAGVGCGIIEKSGAWYYWKEQKLQGEAKMYKYFEENPEELKELTEQLKELLS